MVFSSILFLFLYLPVVLTLYYVVPVRWRNPCLFIANLVFYGWGEPVYILLMMFSITVNFFAGKLIDRYRANDKKARGILVGNIIINLAMLMFFKYYELFAETVSLIPGVNVPTLGLELPIGISFYTFQTMSYPIDVYRGDADVQKNYISFGTFVALFPQLIAGPIVRYKDVASQLDFRANSVEQFSSGVRRFLVGLAKKVLIANNIGLLWDTFSAMPASELTVLGSWMGIIAFSMQIYFDFSGYSDMAIGLGRMLGFEFLENFDYPYISQSVTEFWRRWHISLGTWFRDYVYIPLGGNRRGVGRQLRNLLTVWLLTGLWHGAAWNYLLWGLYYGILLILEKFVWGKALQRLPKPLQHLYALLLILVGWLLFRASGTSQVVTFLKAMVFAAEDGVWNAQATYLLLEYRWELLGAVLFSFPVIPALRKRLERSGTKAAGVCPHMGRTRLCAGGRFSVCPAPACVGLQSLHLFSVLTRRWHDEKSVADPVFYHSRRRVRVRSGGDGRRPQLGLLL